MSDVLKRARVSHIFGDEEPSGWIPSGASRPQPTPRVEVDLDIVLERSGNGFVLQWEGPAADYCGDLWYAQLEDAEQAAAELFGIQADGWEVAQRASAPYQERFPVGSRVSVASHAFLQQFRASWANHNPLSIDQLAFADRDTTVQEVGFYQGGDVIYQLKSFPGVWHEACLVEI